MGVQWYSVRGNIDSRHHRAHGPVFGKQRRLAGRVVIEAGELIAGAFCGQRLGDLGALGIRATSQGRAPPRR